MCKGERSSGARAASRALCRSAPLVAPLPAACAPLDHQHTGARAMMRPSEGAGEDADSASATHAALLSALERMTAQEEAAAAARRAALTSAAYDTEAEGGSPAGVMSPWHLLSRETSADDLLADVAGAQRGRVASQVRVAAQA